MKYQDNQTVTSNIQKVLLKDLEGIKSDIYKDWFKDINLDNLVNGTENFLDDVAKDLKVKIPENLRKEYIKLVENVYLNNEVDFMRCITLGTKIAEFNHIA